MKRLLISAALAFGLIGGARQRQTMRPAKSPLRGRRLDRHPGDDRSGAGAPRSPGLRTRGQQLAVPVTYASLKSKDLDVFLGNWMPSMTADVTPYLEDKSVEIDCSEPRQCRLRSRCAPIRGGRRSEESHGSRRPQGQVRRQDLRHRGGQRRQPHHQQHDRQAREQSRRLRTGRKLGGGHADAGRESHEEQGLDRVPRLDAPSGYGRDEDRLSRRHGRFSDRRREGLHQRAGRPAPAVPQPRPTPQEPQVQPRHGRRDDGASAQGRRGPQGNGSRPGSRPTRTR